MSASQVPVQVRGALTEWLTVSPGDIIVGDADGVIVVPQQMLKDITAKVIERSRSESGARPEIASGLPLLDALKKFGHL